MNWLDVVLIVLGVASVIEGFKTGFVRGVLGLVALIAGLLCAAWFYSSVGAYFGDRLSRRTADLLAFFVIFLGILVLGAVAGAILQRLLRMVDLSWLDRLMGGAFGAVRAALVAAVIVLAVLAFAPQPGPRAVTDSHLAPYVIDGARAMAAAAPYELKEGFRQSYDRVKQIWADTLKHGLQRPARQQM